MEQISAIGQKSAAFHRDIARHLLHPLLIWMTRDTRQAYPSALQVKKEQYIKCSQASQCEYFHSKEVRSHYHGHVGTDEVLPTGGFLPFWRRRNVVPLQDIADCLIRDLVA